MGRKGWCWMAGALLCWTPTGVLAQSVNMGTTFHELEGRAQRVVATFSDAEVETTRGPDGAWQATLRDRQGRVRASLRGQRGHRSVQFRPQGRPADARAFELAESTEVGLDWAALQTYATWTDDESAAREGQTIDPSAGQWDGHIRRDARARRAVSAAQLGARLQRVRTEFPEVEVTASVDQHRRVAGKAKVDYSKFTARVRDRRTGRDKGFVRWFDTAQVLTWQIEGGGSGVVMPDRLREGWTFTPTMAWANVQAYYFATRPQHAEVGGPVARRLGDLFARPDQAPALGQVAWLGPVAGVSQTLPWRLPLPSAAAFAGGGAAANEPGCDNLHWLDHTIFRACCDRHDTCYEKSGCSASSWRWPFSGSWQCASCNAQAVWCFCTLANPYHCGGSGGGGGGGGGDDNGNCARTAGGFCPVTCSTCISA